MSNLGKYTLGLAISAIGIITLIVGAVFTYSIDVIGDPTVSILAVDDAWVRFIGTHSAELYYAGMMIMIPGILLKWKAEDLESALERTNRFVPYKPKGGLR